MIDKQYISVKKEHIDKQTNYNKTVEFSESLIRKQYQFS